MYEVSFFFLISVLISFLVQFYPFFLSSFISSSHSFFLSFVLHFLFPPHSLRFLTVSYIIWHTSSSAVRSAPQFEKHWTDVSNDTTCDLIFLFLTLHESWNWFRARLNSSHRSVSGPEERISKKCKSFRLFVINASYSVRAYLRLASLHSWDPLLLA